jgi:hypothetical protein
MPSGSRPLIRVNFVAGQKRADVQPDPGKLEDSEAGQEEKPVAEEP